MMDEREATSLATSYTETSQILMPNDTNNLGRALGGTVLHWMDICGAIACRRFARRQVVTASMDHVDFLGPIDVGDVVSIEGYVFDTGETSMDVLVTVSAERPVEGNSHETATSFFTFVALDEAGEPTQVPDLECPTDRQRELRDQALAERRARREELVERLDDADRDGEPSPPPTA